MLFQIKNVTVGTDPEVFIRDIISKKIISAEGLIGGTKQRPLALKARPGCAIQEDNVMAEFNVNYTTLDNPKALWSDIDYVLKHIDKKVAKVGYEIAIHPSAKLEWKWLDTEQARIMGCDPDYNAWIGDINKKEANTTNLRCCGGHIHIGYDNPEIQVSVDLIKLMDLYLGVPSILLDSDTDRKKLYGKAGCFRFTDFGCEYRVLSNFWIGSLKSVQWMFRQVRLAVAAYNKGMRIEPNSELGLKVQKCIDHHSVELAKELMENYVNKKQLVEA